MARVDPAHVVVERAQAAAVVHQGEVGVPRLALGDVAPVVREPHPEVVRSGDVRHRGEEAGAVRQARLVEAARRVAVAAQPAVDPPYPAAVEARAVPGVDRRAVQALDGGLLGAHRAGVAGRLDAREEVVRPVHDDAVLVGEPVRLADEREAGLEQQAVADRRGPLRVRVVVVDGVDVRRGGVAVLEGAELVEPVAVRLVDVGDPLVGVVHLRGEPDETAPDAVVVDGGRAVPVRGVEHLLVGAPLAPRGEEPDPVLPDGPAEPELGIVGAGQPGLGPLRDADPPQPLVEVVLGQGARGGAAEERSAEAVAPLARGDVDPHAAVSRLRVHRVGGDGHLLRHLGVVVRLDAAVVEEGVQRHAVDLQGRLARARPAAEHPALLHGARAADVGPNRLDPRHQRGVVPEAAAGRNRLLGLAGQRLDPRHPLHVHDRGLAADGDRLLERADRQRRVDRQREVAGQGQAVADLGREPHQRERDDVVSRLQVDDGVTARAVGDPEARSLDQHRARRLDRHARQDPAGVVRHLPGDAALRQRRRRQRHRERGDPDAPEHLSHDESSFAVRTGRPPHACPHSGDSPEAPAAARAAASVSITCASRHPVSRAACSGRRDRLGRPPQRQQGDGQVVVGLGHVRLDRDGGAVFQGLSHHRAEALWCSPTLSSNPGDCVARGVSTEKRGGPAGRHCAEPLRSRTRSGPDTGTHAGRHDGEDSGPRVGRRSAQAPRVSARRSGRLSFDCTLRTGRQVPPLREYMKCRPRVSVLASCSGERRKVR